MPSPDHFDRDAAARMFAEFEAMEPDAAERLNAELGVVREERYQPIEFVVDPLSAYFLAGLIDLALSHPATPPYAREVGERVYEGIIKRLQRQMPQLAEILRRGHQQRHPTQS